MSECLHASTEDGGFGWKWRVKMANKYIGSDFDDFLGEDGILAEVEAVAIKRVIALGLTQLKGERLVVRSDKSDRQNTQ